MVLSKSKGEMKGKTITDAEYEKVREDAFEKLYKKIQ